MHAHHSINYKPAVTKGGYTDRILHVNLSTSQIDIWEMPFGYKDKYVGGRGYALAGKKRGRKRVMTALKIFW